MCLSFPCLPRGEIQSSPHARSSACPPFAVQVYQRSFAQLLSSPVKQDRRCWSSNRAESANSVISTGRLESPESPSHFTRYRRDKSQSYDSDIHHPLTRICTLADETRHISISTPRRYRGAVTSHCSHVFRISPFPANVASQVSTCRWNAKASTAAEARLECGHDQYGCSKNSGAEETRQNGGLH
jgi:hypothetical protein